MENISEKCKQRKQYLQSYVVLSSSIKVIENVINTFEYEQSQYASIIQNEVILDKINMALERLIFNLSKILNEKNKVCRIILKEIEEMDSGIEQNILLLKYINGYTWEQICEMMNYSLRQVYYIHKHALQHFGNKLIEEHSKEEGE